MRKNSNIPVSVENAIMGMIKSLPYYEAEYVSLLRSPGSIDKERMHSFQQYIECRINNEFFSVPEVRDIVENFDGYLIVVTSVSQEAGQEERNKYREIRIEINEYCPEYLGDDIEADLERLRSFLGGTRFIIRSAPRKPDIKAI